MDWAEELTIHIFPLRISQEIDGGQESLSLTAACVLRFSGLCQCDHVVQQDEIIKHVYEHTLGGWTHAQIYQLYQNSTRYKLSTSQCF